MGLGVANFGFEQEVVCVSDNEVVGLGVLGLQSMEFHYLSSSVTVQIYRASTRLRSNCLRERQEEVTSHTEKSSSSNRILPLPNKEKMGAPVRGLLNSPDIFGTPTKADWVLRTQEWNSS